MVIGLTGGSGSGKSTVSTILKELGMFIIDSDKIAHDIIKKGNNAYNEVIELFSTSILDSREEIDRKALANIVFKDKSKLLLLTNCTHKYIISEIKQIINNNINKQIVIDAPLLIEAGLNKITNEVWAVYADLDIRIERIVKRDNISHKQAKDRIACQMSWEELRSYANVIIYNNKGIQDIVEQIIRIKKFIDN